MSPAQVLLLARLRSCIAQLRFAAGLTGLLLFAAVYLPQLLSEPSGAYQHRLGHALEQAVLPGRRLIGAIPREHAKTTLGTVVLCLREICLGGKRNIMLVAASRREAQAKLRLITNELEANERLIGAFGPAIRPARDSKGHNVAYGDAEIVLAGGARISTLGFGGKIRGQLSGGRRLDLIVLDDPEDYAMVRSALRRQRLREWCDLALLNALDVTGGSIVWLGTLLHHDSVLKQWMQRAEGRAKWESLCWSALSESGEPLWPGRWTAGRLLERRAEIGERAFAQEYLNQPLSENSRVFADTDFRVYDPALLTQLGTELRLGKLPLAVAAGVDPAIGQNGEHDYFAVVVIGVASPQDVLELGLGHDSEHPLVFVLDVLRERVRFAKQLELLSQLALRWNPRLFGVESIAYQQVLAESLRELGLPVRELKLKGEKERRIEAAALHAQQGRVYLPAVAPFVAGFRKEACDFPAGSHDDQLDAFAFALLAGLPLAGEGAPLRAEPRPERDMFAGPARISRF